MVKQTAGILCAGKMCTTFILHEINEGDAECSKKILEGTESGGSGENAR